MGTEKGSPDISRSRVAATLSDKAFLDPYVLHAFIKASRSKRKHGWLESVNDGLDGYCSNVVEQLRIYEETQSEANRQETASNGVSDAPDVDLDQLRFSILMMQNISRSSEILKAQRYTCTALEHLETRLIQRMADLHQEQLVAQMDPELNPHLKRRGQVSSLGSNTSSNGTGKGRATNEHHWSALTVVDEHAEQPFVNGQSGKFDDEKPIVGLPTPAPMDDQTDRTIFNGCISCESEERPLWLPVRGKYDTGSVGVNLISKDIVTRGRLESRVRPAEPLKIASAVAGAGFEVSQRIILVWAPNNSWRSFVTEFYLVPSSTFDILLCNDYVTNLDLINNNESFDFTHLGLGLRMRLGTQSSEAPGNDVAAREAEEAALAKRRREDERQKREARRRTEIISTPVQGSSSVDTGVTSFVDVPTTEEPDVEIAREVMDDLGFNWWSETKPQGIEKASPK